MSTTLSSSRIAGVSRVREGNVVRSSSQLRHTFSRVGLIKGRWHLKLHLGLRTQIPLLQGLQFHALSSFLRSPPRHQPRGCRC